MRRRGFSLVETLVVVAIISILASMYLSALSKARQRAVRTANLVGLHDEGIGRLASGTHGGEGYYQPTRQEARAAFREIRGPAYANGDNVIMSKMLFVIPDDATFQAYWHTLLDPANEDPLEYQGSRLKAKDEAGNEFMLDPIGDAVQGRVTNSQAPLEWEFISTDLRDTSSGNLGANVLYPDGHVAYAAYPGTFPATRTVAELSHRFMAPQE